MNNFKYNLQPYQVDLITPFGTSHSVTSSRLNAYLEVNEIGCAEVGLPPKKENCYFSDFNDCKEFLQLFLQIKSVNDQNPFQDFKDSEYFKFDCSPIAGELNKLDQMPKLNKYLAPKALVECALFDWLAKATKTPISLIINPSNHQQLLEYKKKNFYTLSFLENEAEVIGLMEEGKKFSTNFKIKVGSDVNYIIFILSQIQTQASMICIDCNCSWNQEIAFQFLSFLDAHPEIKKLIYMIEQPFPIDFQAQDWLKVKQEYAKRNIEIFADESIKTADDVDLLRIAISGVNVKIEKAGGYRGAVQALLRAKQLNLKCWIGIMVGSSLNSNKAFNLIGMADVGGDLDGSFYVNKTCEKVKLNFEYQDGFIRYIVQ